jgi:pimeloyl-ACP methyl ester carboxylesterase
MRRINSDGVELSLLDEGQGSAVLLLHGFPDSARLWRHQMPTLTDAGFRVVAPDLRGFGASDKPTDVSDYRIGRSVADMVAVLDELQIDRAHVVGHDWGAAVAWALALMAPDRVDRLVAMSVGHPGVKRNLAQREKAWYSLLFQFEEAEAILQQNDSALLREWAASHPDFDLDSFDLTAGLNWYRANLHPRRELDPPRALPPVKADTLGLWSTGDAYLLERGLTESAAHVEGSWRYERIENAGHWMQLDQPERINALLLDFLA